MKTAIALLFAFVLTTGAAIAQTLCLSQNRDAVPIDTVTTTIGLTPSYTSSAETYDSTSGGGDSDGSGDNTKSKSGGVIIEIMYLRVGDHIEGTIRLESLRFTGDPASIDSVSTQELFDLIAQVVVGQALHYGYATCYTTCGVNNFRVNLPACVERMGRGLETRFISCMPGYCCTRIYTTCCPDGTTGPVIKLIGSEGGGSCAGVGSGNCESLCR